MKVCRILTLGSAALAFAASSQAAGDATWLTSYTKAMQLSRQTTRPILMLFTGSDWCPPCKALEAEVFRSANFASWAKSRVILLKVDILRNHPQPAEVQRANQSLAAQFHVDAFPTVLFIAPAGQILGRQRGYEPSGPSFWMKTAEYVIKSGARTR